MILNRTVLTCSLVLAGVALSAAGCKSSEPNSEDTTKTEELPTDDQLFELSFEATPELEARAKELAEAIDSTTWQYKKGTFKGAADVPAALLALSRRNPGAESGAALDALKNVITPKSEYFGDYTAAVRANLKAKTERLVGRALSAATVLLKGEGDASVLSAIAGLATEPGYKDGAGRTSLLIALRDLSGKNERKYQLLSESLKSKDTGVLVEAMTQLNQMRMRPKHRIELAPLALPLMRHKQAVVRGVAAELVGNTSKGIEEAEQQLLSALSDPSPFVKSKAVMAVGSTRNRGALHLIVPMVSDHTEDRADYEYATLEKKSNRGVLSGSIWAKVSDASQIAVRRLAGKDLDLVSIAPKDVEGSLNKNAAKIKAWYAANKSKLPKLEAPKKTDEAAAKDKTAAANAPKAPSAAAKAPAKPQDKPASAPKQ